MKRRADKSQDSSQPAREETIYQRDMALLPLCRGDMRFVGAHTPFYLSLRFAAAWPNFCDAAFLWFMAAEVQVLLENS